MDNIEIFKELFALTEGINCCEVEIEYRGCRLKVKKELLPETKPTETSKEKKDDNRYEIKSPWVGILHLQPGPEAEPFAVVGDKIKKGKTLCIIKAAKMNEEIEIKSEADGQVTAIPVKNEQPVQYGDLLFIIEKTGGQ